MFKAGLDVARLNCSHATHADLAFQTDQIQRVSRALRKPVATLLDLCGPKVRTGKLEWGTMELKVGERLSVVPGDAAGRDTWITCNHDGLAGDVQPGHRILLDDGLMELVVVGIDGEGVVETEIITGGTLKERKGMNLPAASWGPTTSRCRSCRPPRTCGISRTSSADTAPGSRSSPRSRSRRRWTTSTRSSPRWTGSWSPAVTWRWRSATTRCR